MSRQTATAGAGPGRAAAAGAVRGAGAGWVTRLAVPGSPALQGLLALAAYLAVWLTTDALPLILHPGRPQLDQGSPDPNFYVWSLRWWPYAIAHGLNPLYSHLVGPPAGMDLAWVTTIPPLALLVSPVTLMTSPVVSFTLLVAASIPVSGWAAFVLCRRLTQRFWPALAAGAVYGFSAYELNHIIAGQLNLAFSLLLPLMAYLAVLWRDERISSRAFIGLLAVTMALQFYLFLETFADMTAVWVLALAIGYALGGRAGRRVVARLSLLAGAAYAIAIVLAAPYLAYALTHVPSGFARSTLPSSLDLAGLVVPRAGQTFGLAWLARFAAPLLPPGRDGYIGIPLLAVAVALAVVSWRSRVTRFLVVMAGLLIITALGPVVQLDGHQLTRVPWAGLWSLPVVRSAYPARLMIFVFLALAVMVALWLAGPSRMPWARWLLALAALAAIGVNTPALQVQPGPGLPAFISTGEYRRYLAPGETVVVASQRGNAGLLWQAETGFYPRLAGGFLNIAITATSLPVPVAGVARRRPTRNEILRFRLFVRQARIGAILVDASSPWRWPVILRKAGLRGQAIGGVILYRTVAWRGGAR